MTHVWPSIRPALRSLLTVLALTGPLMERVAAQQLDVNRFVVPTDRDEALFLVNFAEYVGWDLWPSKDAQLDAIQDYARIWMPVVAHYEERAAVAQLHPEVKKILGNLRAFLAANQTYGSSARRFETDSQDRVQEKAGKMGETLTEETLRLLLEKALGTPSSFEAQRRVTARRVFDATSDAVKAKTQVDADLPRWHSQQRLNLQALQQSHFESARLGVAVLKVSHSWTTGETMFDGSAKKLDAATVNLRPRDPFLAHPFFARRAATQEPFAAMADAAFLFDRARYVPDVPVYKVFQLTFLGEAARLATDAAARDQSSYSMKPRMPAVMAKKLWERFLEKSTNDFRPTVSQVMHLGRSHAFNGNYEAAVTVTGICATKSEYKNDAYFHYRFARMLSLAGRTAEALTELRSAYANGFTDRELVQTDPDLQNVRTKHVAEVAGLLR